MVRAPACAGRFYPANPSDLSRMVRSFIAAARVADEPAPKALIAPHAGYLYSGPVAASAYARFQPAHDLIKRVILVGPSHHAEFCGLAMSSADAFMTPLGLVPLDKEALAQIRSLPQVIVFDGAHDPEHCLEVQLPFLQTILDEFTLLPLLAGNASDEQIVEALAALWNGPETRIVVSSDLSHYQDYAAARMVDQTTAQDIETLRTGPWDENRACGFRPIRGLLHLARRRGLKPRCIDLRNSGDTAGPRDRVVGYGAFAFTESH
ncbi:MAG: AmmeMemoRadiSam system protein B [Verrucomicrobia bacterium]|nr:MAG: AmmeMemoRadiSam system protein B [Verrucomicrobiota bacterium]